MDSQEAKVKMAKQNSRSTQRLFLPIAVLIVSLGLIQAVRVVSAVNRLQQDICSLQGMEEGGSLTAAQPNPSGGVDAQLTQTIRDFRDLRGTVDGLVYLGPLFGWVPRYGGDLAAAPDLMGFGERVSVSAEDLLTLTRAFNAEIEKGRASKTPIGVSVLQVAQSQGALIEQARRDLAETVNARARIDSTKLSPTLQNVLSRFDRYLPLWQAGFDAMSTAPILLGADRPRVYLLVAQNSDELRATGGFVTGVSLLRIDQGKITVSDYLDSYAIDDLSKPRPDAPDPLRRYMYAYYWVFRDANWSPDFPTAAKQLETIYQIDQGIAADGVIAINQKLIPRLLQALGPVTIDAYNERVDAANVMTKIQTYWASPQGIGESADWWAHRKDFTGKLFETMMSRVLTGDVDRVQLGAALIDGIMSKDLLIYVNDADATGKAGLSQLGALTKGSGDALMIVDSNVGFNKVDGNIQRQADYAVTVDSSGAAKATLIITYTNLSNPVDSFCVHQPHYLNDYAELQQGCYWDYVRVIVPGGAGLFDATRELEASAEPLAEGRTSFGGYFVLARGESKTVRFDYSLPSLLKDQSNYTLHLEKQPGTNEIPFSVRVTLPKEWRGVSMSPPASRLLGNTAEFAVLLDTDQEIQLSVDKSSTLPTSFVAGIFALGVSVFIIFFLSQRRRTSPRSK